MFQSRASESTATRLLSSAFGDGAKNKRLGVKKGTKGVRMEGDAKNRKAEMIKRD